jgi:hypothetical protein
LREQIALRRQFKLGLDNSLDFPESIAIGNRDPSHMQTGPDGMDYAHRSPVPSVWQLRLAL